MGCRRSILSVFTAPPTALLLILVSIIMLTALSDGMTAAEERTPVRGRTAPSLRSQPSGFAEAARIVAERLVAAFPRVQGLIIGFEGDLVLIDRGTADGVVQGMELDVFREGEEFKHPLTGESLGRLDKDLGMVRVLRARERYAEATIVKKAEKAGFRKGDQVRVSMARMIAAFPNVDVEGVEGVGARSMTRDLAAALVRTGRFELVEDRQLRSMLLVDREFKAAELADPKILKQLADRGKIQVLLLSRLTPSAEGLSLDVQAYSTSTGNLMFLASAMVEAETAPLDTSSRRPAPTLTVSPTAATPAETGKPRAASPGSAEIPDASVASEYVVLEPVLDGSITAMGVADLDGDGKGELVVAGSGRLLAFRFDDSHLRLLAEYRLSGTDRVVTLEAQDVTGDGRAEVLMTLSYKDRFRALVVQWTDGTLKPVWEMPDLAVRPLSPDGKTVQLFGQAVIPGESTAKPIHRYIWDGRSFQVGSILDVPAGLSLLKFHMVDAGGEGAVWLITFLRGATLEVGSKAGKLISRYVVSDEQIVPKNGADPRILIDKHSEKERPQIILRREQKGEGALLGRWGDSRTVGVIALRWDGERFYQVRQVPISDGILADYAVADLGDGIGRRLLALVVKSGRLGFGKRTEIHAFRL